MKPESTGGTRKAPNEAIAGFLKSVEKRVMTMAHTKARKTGRHQIQRSM